MNDITSAANRGADVVMTVPSMFLCPHRFCFLSIFKMQLKTGRCLIVFKGAISKLGCCYIADISISSRRSEFGTKLHSFALQVYRCLSSAEISPRTSSTRPTWTISPVSDSESV